MDPHPHHFQLFRPRQWQLLGMNLAIMPLNSSRLWLWHQRRQFQRLPWCDPPVHPRFRCRSQHVNV